MRIVFILLLLASLGANVAMGGFIAVGVATRASFTDMMRKGAKFLKLPPVGRWQPNRDYQGVQPCDLKPSFVVLVIGQSNGANAAFSYTKAQDPDARAFYGGACYGLSDPVIGGDGSRGSQWPIFADLFKAQFGRSATMISAGWGGSSIADWTDNGYDRFALSQVRALRDAGRSVDAVFWQQGEQDFATDPAVYKAKFAEVMQRLRDAGVTAPIFVARATLSAERVNEPLRQAQAELAAQPGFALGPDADSVTDRFDKYHFTPEGVAQMAKLWLDAVIACDCIAKD
jgi:lysophospholipase L1-like esterase